MNINIVKYKLDITNMNTKWTVRIWIRVRLLTRLETKPHHDYQRFLDNFIVGKKTMLRVVGSKLWIKPLIQNNKTSYSKQHIY
jgi:hypothetical protein